MENKNLYIIGGIGAVVVILLVLRKGSSQPTVITAGNSQPSSDPNQVRLAEQALNADTFKTVAGLVYGNRASRMQQDVQLAQIEAGRQVGINQTSAAIEVAKAQNSLQASAIQAARDVGLAQASADITRTQLQNEAIAQQQSSQNRNNLLTGLLSQIGNVLRTIGQQPRSSGSGSSGSSGSAGTPTGTISRPTARLNPYNFPVPLGTEGVDLAGLTGFFGGPPDVTFPEILNPYGDLGGFGDAPAPYGQPGGFYVDEPVFSGPNLLPEPGGFSGFYDPGESPFGNVDFGTSRFDDTSLGEPPAYIP